MSIRTLHPDLAEVAQHECHEDAEKVTDEIDKFRDWIMTQTHLKVRTDSQFLVGFLRFCKYDMETAQKRLDYYYTYKSTTSQWLKKDGHIDDKILSICTTG